MTRTRRPLGRHHDGIVRSAVQNGWILAGVLFLGWSAALVIAGVYLETLFVSLGLAYAVRALRRQHVKADKGTVGDVTKKAVIVGLAQGGFLVAFLVAVLIDPEGVQPRWRIGPHELTLVIVGALLAAAADSVSTRRRVRSASDRWVRGRADRQLMAALALLLLMLIVPWSFLLIGERGMVVTLFVLKGLLDVWTVGASDGGA